MHLSQADLIEIVCRASTLTERLSQKFEFDDSRNSDNDEIVNSRLEQWCQVIAQGDWDNFEKYLAWDGFDLNTVRKVVGFQRLVDGQHLPAWTTTFNEAMKTVDQVYRELLEKETTANTYCLNPQNPLPFEQLLLPFIYVARKKLSIQTSSDYHLLSEETHARLENRLLRRLTSLCSPAMELKFSIFCISKQLISVHLSSQLNDNTNKNQYLDFLKKMLESELLSFFKEYSVLARLVATVTDFWVDTTKEFICRLASDSAEIQNVFGQTKLGQVVAVETDLSDHHNGGHTVIALRFACGLKLLYKPKACFGMEEAYFKLLGWLNDKGIPLSFRTIKVINRSTYGWVEFVEHLPCHNEAEARKYYQRAGMLLCLVHILAGTDFHFENIIASGEHPVLIDLETLMHPNPRISKEQDDVEGARHFASKKLRDSVIQTGLLPSPHLGQSGQGVDFTGLGAVGEQETAMPVPTWSSINTDNMGLSYKHIKIQAGANLPLLEDNRLKPENYLEEIVEGFRQMYQFLMEHQTALLASDSPLTEFAHQSVRFVFLATRVYGSTLIKTTHPKFLKDGIERRIQLETIKNREIFQEKKPAYWPLLEAEQQMLEQMDIPLFTAHSDSSDLTISPAQVVENFFSEPSYNLMISRLQQLSNEDLEYQINIIKGSFYTRNPKNVHRQQPPENTLINLSTFISLTQEEMVQQEVKIATDVRKWAIFSANGDSAAWIAPSPIENSQRWYQLQVLGPHLYDGCCGVALFLAALAKVTGDAEFRNLALAALQPLRQALKNSLLDEIAKEITTDQTTTNHALQIGIGGLTGLGSLIYALVRISQFLELPILLDEAQKIASLFTPDLIFTDKTL